MGDLPEVTVGIGEVPGVAAVGSLPGWAGDSAAGSLGCSDDLIDFLRRTDVLRQDHAIEASATLTGFSARVVSKLLSAPKHKRKSARLEEDGLVYLLAVPAHRFVEEPRPREVVHTQRYQAHPLLHIRNLRRYSARSEPDALGSAPKRRIRSEPEGSRTSKLHHAERSPRRRICWPPVGIFWWPLTGDRAQPAKWPSDGRAAEQLSRYQTLAPAEIKDAVDSAAAPLFAAGSDPVKFFIAVADDAVQAAIYRIDAWENANCGVGHPDDSLAGNATRDHEDGAAVVKVTAIDFQFAFDTTTIASGRTSFVLTNNGQEAHMMDLFKMAAGVTMDQLLKSDTGGEGLIDGYWGSNVAAPGGGDEEVVTLDLAPGHYGIACFVAGADGTPHAMTGMTKEFTVP